jgi:hypothetical protein
MVCNNPRCKSGKLDEMCKECVNKKWEKMVKKYWEN